MSTSPRAGSVNSSASSTVTPGISPTVSSPSRPAKTSRCISCRNSWMPRAVRVAARRRRRRAARVLGDHVDDVHPEAVDAPVEPPAHHRVDGLADLGVLPVEVGLLAREQVQVVLAGRRVELPRRPAEERAPVGRRRRPPPVPVALRVVLRRARLDEPRVLVGGVVDHEVHDQLHAARVHAREQLVEVRERPEHRVDVLVVADVVAGVVLRRRVDRREPEHVDAELGEVVEVADDPAQVADPVAVGVREAARIDLVDDRLLNQRHAREYSRLRAVAGPLPATGAGRRRRSTGAPGTANAAAARCPRRPVRTAPSTAATAAGPDDQRRRDREDTPSIGQPAHGCRTIASSQPRSTAGTSASGTPTTSAITMRHQPTGGGSSARALRAAGPSCDRPRPRDDVPRPPTPVASKPERLRAFDRASPGRICRGRAAAAGDERRADDDAAAPTTASTRYEAHEPCEPDLVLDAAVVDDARGEQHRRRGERQQHTEARCARCRPRSPRSAAAERAQPNMLRAERESARRAARRARPARRARWYAARACSSSRPAASKRLSSDSFSRKSVSASAARHRERERRVAGAELASLGPRSSSVLAARRAKTSNCAARVHDQRVSRPRTSGADSREVVVAAPPNSRARRSPVSARVAVRHARRAPRRAAAPPSPLRRRSTRAARTVHGRVPDQSSSSICLTPPGRDQHVDDAARPRPCGPT